MGGVDFILESVGINRKIVLLLKEAMGLLNLTGIAVQVYRSRKSGFSHPYSIG
jgi:hypothetical protein